MEDAAWGVGGGEGVGGGRRGGGGIITTLVWVVCSGLGL